MIPLMPSPGMPKTVSTPQAMRRSTIMPDAVFFAMCIRTPLSLLSLYEPVLLRRVAQDCIQRARRTARYFPTTGDSTGDAFHPIPLGPGARSQRCADFVTCERLTCWPLDGGGLLVVLILLARTAQAVAQVGVSLHEFDGGNPFDHFEAQ